MTFHPKLIIFALLLLLSTRVRAATPADEIRAGEIPVLARLRAEDPGGLSKIEAALEVFRRRVGRFVRLKVDGVEHIPCRINVCEELGSCPENDDSSRTGGSFCCSSAFADDTLHVEETMDPTDYIWIGRGSAVRILFPPGMAIPLCLKVDESLPSMTPGLRYLKVGPDGLIGAKLAESEMMTIVAIWKSDGDIFYKKAFWVLRGLK